MLLLCSIQIRSDLLVSRIILINTIHKHRYPNTGQGLHKMGDASLRVTVVASSFSAAPVVVRGCRRGKRTRGEGKTIVAAHRRGGGRRRTLSLPHDLHLHSHATSTGWTTADRRCSRNRLTALPSSNLHLRQSSAALISLQARRRLLLVVSRVVAGSGEVDGEALVLAPSLSVCVVVLDEML